jgi:hypothetical protein
MLREQYKFVSPKGFYNGNGAASASSPLLVSATPSEKGSQKAQGGSKVGTPSGLALSATADVSSRSLTEELIAVEGNETAELGREASPTPQASEDVNVEQEEQELKIVPSVARSPFWSSRRSSNAGVKSAPVSPAVTSKDAVKPFATPQVLKVSLDAPNEGNIEVASAAKAETPMATKTPLSVKSTPANSFSVAASMFGTPAIGAGGESAFNSESGTPSHVTMPMSSISGLTETHGTAVAPLEKSTVAFPQRESLGSGMAPMSPIGAMENDDAIEADPIVDGPPKDTTSGFGIGRDFDGFLKEDNGYSMFGCEEEEQMELFEVEREMEKFEGQNAAEVIVVEVDARANETKETDAVDLTAESAAVDITESQSVVTESTDAVESKDLLLNMDTADEARRRMLNRRISMPAATKGSVSGSVCILFTLRTILYRYFQLTTTICLFYFNFETAS